MMKLQNFMIVIPRRGLLRALLAALLALAAAAPLQAATKSKTFTMKPSSLANNRFYQEWFANNPTGADSVYRFILTFCPGRNKHNPMLYGSGSRTCRMWRGHSLRVATDPTYSATTTRNVTKVEIKFNSTADDFKGSSELWARTGTITYNTSTKTATWVGRAPSIEIFIAGDTKDNFSTSVTNPYTTGGNARVAVLSVTTTITYDTGDDCVCQPTFTPCNQYDFSTASKEVTMDCSTPGADIYYTTDGTTPTTSSTLYTGPVTIDRTTLFRAIAVKDGVSSGEDTCKIFKNTCDFKLGDEDFFRSKTYTWVDVNNTRGQGAGAVITSDMTEEATTTEQIIALLRTVYTDPEIPGQVYQNPGEELTYNRYTYLPEDGLDCGYTKSNYNFDTKEVVDGLKYWYTERQQDPVEGYTVMLVKVRDDYSAADYDAGIYKHGDNGGTAYTAANANDVYKLLSESYESVRVVYGTYYKDDSKGYLDEGYNPGALFQFDATASRFFFISKGSALWSSSYPLLGLYEEVAPENDGFANHIYSYLMDNNTLLSSHDCPSVPIKGHMLSMDENKSSYQLYNVILFMPDYRLKFWEQNAQSTRWPVRWNNYYNRNRDLCGTHGIQAYHPGYEPRLMLYTIKLGATAAPTEKEHVYRSTPSWQSTVGDISPSVPIPQEYLLYEVRRDAQGNESLVPLNDGKPIDDLTTYGYEVPQEAYTYTITYLVKGRVKGSDAEYVFSNYADVVIPGYEDPRLVLLSIGTRYTSTYSPAKQVNIYKNYPQVVNDPASPMKDNRIAQGTQIYIHRYDNAQGEPQDDNVVATIEVLTKTGVTGGGYTFTAKVTPNAATQDNVDSSLYPGTFTFTSGSNGIINFGSLYVTDQFSASTADNDHPDAYYYQLTMTDATGEYCESRLVKAPVYKTDYTAMLAPYSQGDVDGDTGRGLSLDQCATFALQVRNDALITEYDILRDQTTLAARAQRLSIGKYTTSGTDISGAMSILARDLAFDDGATEMTVGLTDFDDYTGGGHNYVAVINVNTTDANDKLYLSTYGTPQQHVAKGGVSVSTGNLAQSDPYYGLQSYAVDVTITVTNPVAGYTPWLYRLWRVNRDGSETLLNGQDEDTGDGWGTNYGVLSATGDLETTVSINDIFHDLQLSKIDGNEFTVAYIARLYNHADITADAVMPDASLFGGAPRRAMAQAAAAFNVAESSATATFNETVITGVTALSTSPTAVGVTYYNLLGTPGATPHPGVNIVVTRLADGTTVTERLLRP